jgi:hypothetical protein
MKRLGLERLPHVGVERTFRYVTEDLNFFVHISLT